jgi:uncharacterized protein YndB with AHSA1/START domain
MTNPTIITALPGQPVLDIERLVDAPVDAVYHAHVDPVLMAQWVGPRGYEMEVTRYEPVDGGAYEFTHTDPNGQKFEFRGSFHSFLLNERVIRTFEFLGVPGHVSLESVDFEDVGGKTLIKARSVFQSVEDRDGMIASGMEHGVVEGYERLDEVLAA